MGRKTGTTVELGKAVEEFFKLLEPQKLAKTTLDSKRRTLRILAEVVGRANASTRKLTDDHFVETMRRLAAGASAEENERRRLQGLGQMSGRRPITMAIDKACLGQFVKFLKHRKWVAASFDPMFQVTASSRDAGDTPPERVSHRRKVPVSEWADLIEAAGEVHPRTRIEVALGLHTGARSSDMAHIQIKHVDMDYTDEAGEVTGWISLYNTKRGRSTAGKTISPWLREELERWFSWYREQAGELQPDWYLCPVKVPPATGRRDLVPWSIDPTRQSSTASITDDIRKALVRHGWTSDMLWQEGEHTLRRSHAAHVRETIGKEAAIATGDWQTEGMMHHYTGDRAGQDALAKGLKAWRKPGATPAVVPAQAPAPVQEQTVPLDELDRAIDNATREQLAEVWDLFSRKRVS